MSIANTKKTAIYIKSGETLPTAPDGYVEATDPILITPTFATIDINRITGKMNAKTTEVDTCRTTASFEVSSLMRTSNIAADALGTPPPFAPLLLAAGFVETIDTTTPDAEFVTYSNNSDNIDNTSAVYYLDGNRYDLTGSLVCGTALDFTIGAVAKITNSFSGFMDSVIPVTEANPTVVDPIEKVLVVSCIDLVLLDGACLAIKSAKIAMNEETAELYTMGGACGLKTNIITDYALGLDLEFFADKDELGREAALIESGLVKEVVIKIGVDANGDYINGKSVSITCPLAKATTYTDTSDTDLLSRSLSLRLFDGATTPAITIKTGFFQ